MQLYEGYYNECPNETDVKRVDIIRYSVTEPDEDDIKQYLSDNDEPYFESTQEKQEFFEENTFFDIEALDIDYNELFTLSDASLSELKDIFDYRIVNMIINNEGRKISQAEKELRDLLDYSLEPIDLNDVNSVNNAAKQIFGESIYVSGEDGYILTDGTFINFGLNKDHQSISSIYSTKTGESMTLGRFVSLGNIRVRGNNINLEKCPTKHQIQPLKELIAYYRRDKVYFEISRYDFSRNDLYGQTILNVVFDRPYSDMVISQIVRYFKEGIKPVGSIVYENYKQKKIDYLISSELITLSEANNQYYNNRFKLDFSYPSSTYYEHISFDDFKNLIESDGINYRFDSIFDEMISLVYDNYNDRNLTDKQLIIETEYVYNSSVKKIKGESEEDFINRCCEPESMHKDSNNVIDKDWHPIDIVLYKKENNPSGYADSRNGIGNNIKTHKSYYKNDRITICINVLYIPRTRFDIANVLQHELTHIIDIFNGPNFHIYNRRSMIRMIDDIFNLYATVSEKLFEKISRIGYYLARCEQVAHYNGLYKYIKYKYNHSNYSTVDINQDMFRICKFNDLLNIQSLLRKNDKNINNTYNGSFVIMFIIIAYYLKFHKVKYFNTTSHYIDYNWISNSLEIFKNYINDNNIPIESNKIDSFLNIGKYITIDDLNINKQDYIRIKNSVIKCVFSNFDRYISETKAKVNKALKENSLDEI